MLSFPPLRDLKNLVGQPSHQIVLSTLLIKIVSDVHSSYFQMPSSISQMLIPAQRIIQLEWGKH